MRYLYCTENQNLPLPKAKSIEISLEINAVLKGVYPQIYFYIISIEKVRYILKLLIGSGD